MTQLQYLMANPLAGVKVIFSTVLVQTNEYLQQLNILGSLNYPLSMLMIIVPCFLTTVGMLDGQSMDGKSRWADNIMIERWFRSFKYEEGYLTQYANIREARAAIKSYVHTYNFERCHSAINDQTPASYYYPALLIDHAA